MRTPSLRQLRWLCSLSVLATVLLLAGCGNSGSPDASASESSSASGVPFQLGEPLSDTTLAVVVSSEYGADTLRDREFERQIQMRTQRLSPDQRSSDTLQAIHKNLVQRFVEGHMMRGKAVAEDFEVDTAQVSQRLSQIKGQYQSEDQLKKQLARNNMTLDSLRSLIAARLQTQELQRRMAEKAKSPSADEVKTFSEENERIRAQHILLRAGKNAPKSKVDSARKAAVALIDSANAGTDFASLARRHSEGPSASKGGDLGFFTKDQMVEPFSKAAFALSDSGDVASDPVRTRFGFHVIRLTNAGEPMDTSKARQRLMQKRQREAYDKELDKLLQDATVRLNPDIVDAGISK
jgi:peptidyl-prolyl cis-trans isomerase C